MDSDLFKIYQSRVVNSNAKIYSNTFNFNPRSSFERDPNLIKLEQSIFGRIQEIAAEPETRKLPNYKNNGIQNISVEDAIKELLKMGDI